MVGALGIDPELEHPPRRVQRAGHEALADALPDVPQLDEPHVVALGEPMASVDRNALDLGVRLFDQLPRVLDHNSSTVAISRLQLKRTAGPATPIPRFT